ncbi:MAG: hypothetical protein LH481_13200 [Burkholderiales bacterium]|nr:hypothetical protein [Burkholderiales bacterium]
MNASSLTPEAWQQFQALVPWFVNDTLAPEDRRRVAHLLSISARCRVELYEVIALADCVRGQTPTCDSSAGLDRLMKMV